MLSALLTACSGKDSEKPATSNNPAIPAYTDNSKVLATVNGKPITQQLFDTYAQQRRASVTAQHQKDDTEQIMDELVNFELLSQDAEKKNIQNEADVAAQLDLQRRNILASAAFRAYTRDNPITDDDLRKDYETRMKTIKLTEYKLRHTLNDKEDAAKAIVAVLDKGAKFSDIAKKQSSGPSAAEGGDLGWLSPQDMVPGFREAALELEKGKYTAPVKTRFGWHVIYLEDKRDSPPPPFEQIREQARQIMQRKQIEDYISGLRSSAKIEIISTEMPAPEVSSDKAADPNPGSPLKSEINLDNRY
jgi:peptidyl-prolyl cis-trans isomerase C